jgi:hypothetical protein
VTRDTRNADIGRFTNPPTGTWNLTRSTTHDHVDRRIIYAVLGGVALLLAAFTLINGIQWISKYSERSRYQSKISELQQQASALSASRGDEPPFKPEAALALQKSSRHANYLIALDIFPWIDILDEIEKTMPPQVILDRFLPASRSENHPHQRPYPLG